MRTEKKYLIEEVARHLKKSDYLLITNYQKVTVAGCRGSSREARSRTGRVPRRQEQLPARRREGGRSPRFRFDARRSDGHRRRRSQRLRRREGREEVLRREAEAEIKGGVVSGKLFDAGQIAKLSELPSLEVLRAQLLGLLNTPATSLVRVINGVPQAFVNVLQAKVRAAA